MEGEIERPSRDVSVTEYFCKYLAGKHCWPYEKIQYKCGVMASVLHKNISSKRQGERKREQEMERVTERMGKRGDVRGREMEKVIEREGGKTVEMERERWGRVGVTEREEGKEKERWKKEGE